MFVLPLMSCGARLPIYTLFVGALFPSAWRAPVMWAMYLVGILVAIVLAKVLRATVFRGEAEPFIMELPPYRAPTLRGALIHMWHRGWLYLRKAGTVILGVSILLWALTSYPRPPADVAGPRDQPGFRRQDTGDGVDPGDRECLLALQRGQDLLHGSGLETEALGRVGGREGTAPARVAANKGAESVGHGLEEDVRQPGGRQPGQW